MARPMRQGAVASVVLAPAAALLIEQRLEAAGIPGALGMFLREGAPFLFAAAHVLVEVVELATGVRLAAIAATGVKKDGPAHLLALPSHFLGGHGRSSDQGMHRDAQGCTGVHTPIHPHRLPAPARGRRSARLRRRPPDGVTTWRSAGASSAPPAGSRARRRSGSAMVVSLGRQPHAPSGFGQRKRTTPACRSRARR